jgi:ribonucleoside-diphosphate reductase alpha chain
MEKKMATDVQCCQDAVCGSESCRTTYKYEDALLASTEYFNGDDLAARVFVDKYALRDKSNKLLEMTPSDMHRRLAKEFARIEASKFKNPLTEQQIFELMDRFRYIVPQGSPMYGIGNREQFISLSNCYVVASPNDSYGSIMAADENLVQISKRRGGVGLNLSNLRPNGSPTRNAARTSTGVVSFAERYSNSIREVGQAGRRGALMLTLDVHHPDISEFTVMKRNLSKVTGANISIMLYDDFLTAVDEGKTYEQKWPCESSNPTMSRHVDASKVWRLIVENAHHMAEPGLLFWDNIIRESPADCYADLGFRTISTNPCSEIPLSAFDSCRLMLLNAFSYVDNPFTEKASFNFELFSEHAKICQRLMDDLVDLEIECIDRIIAKVNSDPEDELFRERELQLWNDIKAAALNGRRTGTGLTAVGDTMAALGIPYASEEGIATNSKIYKTLKLAAYRSSVDMAREIGSFPIWSHERESDNPFLCRIRDEDPALYADMRRYGRRNIALLTTAPCGSVSILTQTSSGIEPQFMVTSYIRRKKGNPGDSGFRVDFVDQNGDSWMEFKVYPPKVKMWIEITGETDLSKSPWSGSCASELDWKKRVELQAAVQKHIDHAISSTLNLPNDATVDAVDEIYRTAWKAGCKGITIYRDGCRTGVLVDEKNAATAKMDEINATKAPKRPETLSCDVHHIQVKGQPFFVIVGLLKGKPYEVFAAPNKTDEDSSTPLVPKSYTSGLTTKEARGKYKIYLSDKSENKLTVDKLNDKETGDEAALTRMISTALRHGADIQFVVQQLEKVKGDMTNFSRSVARALKKYIPDGTEVTGETCENCENKDKCSLARQEGCVMCKSCGWTKCN